MPPLQDYEPLFQAAAKEWDVDPDLLKAVAGQESGGTPRAVSRAGAEGVMQITPETQRYLGITNPRDPAQSIFGGAKYLAEARDAEKTPESALLYYHGGPKWRDNYGPESAGYVPAVAGRYRALLASGKNTSASGEASVATDPKKKAPAEEDPDVASGMAIVKGASSAPAEVDPDEAAGLALVKQYSPKPKAAPPPAPDKPASMVDDFGRTIETPGTAADTSLPALPRTIPEARQMLAETPGWTSSGILPLRVKQDANGQADMSLGVRPDLGPIRGVGNALLDLLEGTKTGTVTPEGTMLLLGAKAGASQNPLAPKSTIMRGPVNGGPALTPVESQALLERSAPLSPEFKANPLAPGVKVGASEEVPTSINPNVAPLALPAPSSGEPKSLGAAASRDTTIRTADLPTETKSAALTNLQKDVTQSATDRAGPGMEDHTVYVPGVERTLAGRVFTPQNALDEKLNIATNPEFRASKEAIDRRSNETMVDYLREDARDPNAVEDAHKARETVAPPAQKLFEGEKPVDASGLVKKIDEVLSGPGGKRGAVSKVLGDVRDKLFDSDGNLETAPSQLYGARQNITDWLKKAAGNGDSAADARLAKAHLVDLLDQLDPVINSGAPKYQAYLKEFSEASKPIDQMEFLQRYQTGAKKITDANGNLMFNKVQKMLDDIYQGRASSKNDPAKSLTDEQIQRVVAVRNELAANALKDRMASVKGSDSVQQVSRGILGGPLGVAVKGAGTLAAHVGTHLLDPTGISNLALAGIQHIVVPAMQRSAEVKAGNALMQRRSDLLSTHPANRLSP